MTVEIEIDELAGCRIIDDDGNTKNWEDITRQQQIRILNSFSNFYGLFVKFLKEE